MMNMTKITILNCDTRFQSGLYSRRAQESDAPTAGVQSKPTGGEHRKSNPKGVPAAAVVDVTAVRSCSHQFSLWLETTNRSSTSTRNTAATIYHADLQFLASMLCTVVT